MSAPDERLVREFFERLRRHLRAAYRGDPSAIAEAEQEADEAYRRLVQEEETESGRPAASPAEAAYRRARRALRDACERGQGLRVLIPISLLRSLRDRAARLRCQVSSVGACVTGSVDAIGAMLVAATFAASSSAVPALASPVSVLDQLGAGIQLVTAHGRSGAPALPLGDDALPASAAGDTTLTPDVASGALPPGAPRPVATHTVHAGQREIAREDRLAVTLGDREIVIYEGRHTIVSCDPDAPVRRFVCIALDAAEGASGSSV